MGLWRFDSWRRGQKHPGTVTVLYNPCILVCETGQPSAMESRPEMAERQNASVPHGMPSQKALFIGSLPEA